MQIVCFIYGFTLFLLSKHDQNFIETNVCSFKFGVKVGTWVKLLNTQKI